MTTILLIRHGETGWNREQVFRGRADIALSERGREQARLLADGLASHPITCVFTSPLARAQETAAPLASAVGLHPVIAPRLIDMSFGDWEGRSRQDVQAGWPELYQMWMTEPARFRAPGGESLSEVMERAWSAVQEIAQGHPGKVVAVVSHRVICKMILCAVLGVAEAGFWRVRVDTASISVLELRGGDWVVTGVNDTHHLAPLAEAGQLDF